MELQNPQPKVFQQSDTLTKENLQQRRQMELDPEVVDEVDKYEIYDMLRHIKDPEHPLTLEQLNIVQVDDIWVHGNKVEIEFTPTIPHCSLAQTIGLTMRVKLYRCLPRRFKVTIRVKSGSHNQEGQINKQIQDKERIQAAMENMSLVNIVNTGLHDSDRLD